MAIEINNGSTVAFRHIAVVYGGTSSERDISKVNAERVIRTLVDCGYDVSELVYDIDIAENLKRLHPDCVFLCVQGKYHGDGTLQAICEHLNIPYTGSKTTAAAIINDKRICKELCKNDGIRTPAYDLLRRKEYDPATFCPTLAYPFVAKGNTQGAGYGLKLIHSAEDLQYIPDLFAYDDELLLEEFIPGIYVTVSLLEIGGQVQTLTIVEGKDEEKGEIILFNGMFTVSPAKISEELRDELIRESLVLFRQYGAHSYARMDFMLDYDNIPYFLECNAVPGLQEESFFPISAELSGISFKQLLETLLKNEQI